MSGGDVGDPLDLASERAELERETRTAEVRAKAALKPGFPGDCDECGEWHSRLIDGACPACRMKYRGEK